MHVKKMNLRIRKAPKLQKVTAEMNLQKTKLRHFQKHTKVAETILTWYVTIRSFKIDR